MSACRDEPECAICRGLTVEVRGHGLETQYRICADWQKPGHMSREQIRARIAEVRERYMPISRRFA